MEGSPSLSRRMGNTVQNEECLHSATPRESMSRFWDGTPVQSQKKIDFRPLSDLLFLAHYMQNIKCKL